MIAEKLKEYEVATFWYDDIVGKVLCYLRYRCETSRGRQVIYKVKAKSGPEAKRYAKVLRQLEGP